MELAEMIRSIPDFPVEGILFRDITTLIKEPDAFQEAVDSLLDSCVGKEIDVVVAIEARGLIFGAPMAYELGAGFVPVRKPDKLPWEKIAASYTLEYGTNVLEMHADAIEPGQRVLIVDDLLATGGSAKATAELVERLGGEVVGFVFLIELTDLKGVEKLEGYEVFSLIKY
ncbi:MAG TPA: adenine phosphoribosyltransferase [Chloroflexi bacterium]|nr:adenine phosphoribosyltransferase [Chloroflexota bacterium]